MSHHEFDLEVDSNDLLNIDDVVIFIDNIDINLTSHELARAGWRLRIRCKHRYSNTIKTTFHSGSNSVIAFKFTDAELVNKIYKGFWCSPYANTKEQIAAHNVRTNKETVKDLVNLLFAEFTRFEGCLNIATKNQNLYNVQQVRYHKARSDKLAEIEQNYNVSQINKDGKLQTVVEQGPYLGSAEEIWKLKKTVELLEKDYNIIRTGDGDNERVDVRKKQDADYNAGGWDADAATSSAVNYSAKDLTDWQLTQEVKCRPASVMLADISDETLLQEVAKRSEIRKLLREHDNPTLKLRMLQEMKQDEQYADNVIAIEHFIKEIKKEEQDNERIQSTSSASR